MRHRSRRPLLDTLCRPRVALGLAALCVGGTGAALVVDTSADEHTAGAPRTHRASGTADPSASPSRTAEPNRSGQRRSTTPSPADSTPAPTAPRTTPDPTPSPEPRRSSPVRAHLDVRVRTPSVPATTPSPSTSSSAPADTSAPDTTISTVSTAGSTAVFRLGSDGAATYQCSVDGGGWTACVPVLTLTGLTPGWHTLAARAVDPAGNVDPSPADTRWHATASSP